MRLRSLLALVLGAAMIPAGEAPADEWWAWAMIDFYRQGPWTGSVFLADRFDDADAFTVELVSPRLHCEAASWLDLGVNLSLLDIANVRTSEHHIQFRPEFEINPRMNLTAHLRLDMRNRLEGRWNQNESLTTHRSRHRAQIGWTLPHPVGPISRLFVSNEWLIDLHRQSWTENRLVPAGLTIHTGPHSDLDLFYMIVSFRQHADWSHESVLGTYLKIRF